MWTCAVLNDYQRVSLGLADWSSLGPDVEVEALEEHYSSDAETVAALSRYDILVVMRERTALNASVLNRLPNLKLIVTGGMRNAAIDVAAAAARGIVISGTEHPSYGAAELVWALILGFIRRLPQEAAAFRNDGPWQSTLGLELRGKRLGIIGLGRLGLPVARVALAFGMEVSAWSRNLSEEKCRSLGVQRAGSLHELLSVADIVSLHLPLNPQSRGLIGSEQLAQMKPSALLVNTSRGPIVDEAALIEALKAGRIAGAALDVFDIEPLPPGHAFRRLENVLATPHLGYVTEETYRGYFDQAIENIRAWAGGAPIRQLA